MKMYLPFGDWSEDGHCRYDRVLIDAPSMNYLLEAQKILKAEYGEDFFGQMADKYEEPHLGDIVWQALKDSEYPIERLIANELWNDWTGLTSLDEVLEEDECPSVSLDFVMDAFIWLLNWKGAQIVRLDEKDNIPTICNWTCKGFETVGYGCYLC